MKNIYKKPLIQAKWIAIWSIIYAILFWVADFFVIKVFSGFKFFNNYGVFYFLFMGIILAILSKAVYSAIRKRNFQIDERVIFWIIAFMFLVWFFEEIFKIIFSNLSKDLWVFLIKGIFISLVVSFLMRISFSKGHFHRRKSFRMPRIPGWFWWVVLIAGVIVLIQLHVPYGSPQPLNDYGLTCKDGKVYQSGGGILGDLIGGLSGFEASMTCLEYKSSRCKYVCVNDKPACQCEAALVHKLFTREGEWIFGGW